MTEPDWQPRPDDDLVEPLFGGLRGDPEQAPPRPATASRLGYWLAWAAALLAVACLAWVLLRS